jgi:hypothetical protein
VEAGRGLRAGNGRKVRFADSVSSKPAAYDVGDTVTVLYLPDEPEEAHIRASVHCGWASPCSVDSAWRSAASAAASCSGVRAARKKKHYLMAYGNAIETEVQGVDRNTDVRDQRPESLAHLLAVAGSGQQHGRIFHSENLWFDPSKFMKRKKVTVLLDPNNPKRYHMEVSFLPEAERS